MDGAMKAPYYRTEGQGRGIPWRPCMPGGRSLRQRALTAMALGTVSHNIILRLMGPMAMRDVERVLNKAAFAHWGQHGSPTA